MLFWVWICFEFESSQGPQNAQNKSNEKHLYKGKLYTSVDFYNPGLALTGFRTTRPCLEQVNLTWARDSIKNWGLVNGELQKPCDLDKL